MTGVFHEGELAVQALAGDSEMAERNSAIISGRIQGGALAFLAQQPMAVLAYASHKRDIWVSVLWGRPGFLRSADGYTVDFYLDQAAVQQQDPLWDSISNDTKEATAVGMLVIELGSRRRIRINGDLIRVDEHVLRLAVRESYPNCPKYITRRALRTTNADTSAIDSAFVQGTALGAEQMAAVQRADVLFLGTIHAERGLDASHRGGAAGFVEVLDAQTLRIPDYLGNGMFNTLGNLAVDPRAAITVPDFLHRRILRLSGTAQTLWNQADEAGLTGGTHRFLRFQVQSWNEQPLPVGLQTEFLDYSPWNPPAAS